MSQKEEITGEIITYKNEVFVIITKLYDYCIRGELTYTCCVFTRALRSRPRVGHHYKTLCAISVPTRTFTLRTAWYSCLDELVEVIISVFTFVTDRVWTKAESFRTILSAGLQRLKQIVASFVQNHESVLVQGKGLNT